MHFEIASSDQLMLRKWKQDFLIFFSEKVLALLKINMNIITKEKNIKNIITVEKNT